MSRERFSDTFYGYIQCKLVKVKDALGLGEEYSFRHTYMTALEKYLRDIDAELPEDYKN